MAQRREINVPQKYKDKYGDNIRIWSYSNVSSIDNCSWEYYLTRVKKLESKDNIYSLCGSMAHDILEAFYNGEIKYEEMHDKFDGDFLSVEVGEYKFSNDKDKNRKMRDTYKNNVLHFFNSHIPVEGKVINEQCVWIDVLGNLFIGYVDAIHKEDDNYVITDYKTSGITEYQGKKKEEKAKQLLIYALALKQMGIPLDKIQARWNFLKYTNVNIVYTLKSGEVKTKDMLAERVKWVSKVSSQLKKDLARFYTDHEEWELDLMLLECIKANNLDSIDESISKNYTLSDAYVYIDINDEEIKKLMIYLLDHIKLIQDRDRNNEKDWERDPIQEGKEYYCNVLCGQRSRCKYYKEHMKKLSEKLIEDIDLLKELDELM